MNIITIIPARGGSKGVPGKNIKDFGGKPLIVRSIEHALQSDLMNAVYVSTDDQKIAEISKNAGAKIIWRPKGISGDTATTESAIEHALSEISPKPDIIVLLQATSPIRPKNAVQNALAKFINESCNSLLSISPTHRFFWRIKDNETIAEYDYLNRPRRQDMKTEDIRYVENGSLYVFSRDNFEKTGNRLGGKIGHIIFDEEYSGEIDSEIDFMTLERIYTKLRGEK
jgi:CMP-N,N'-diacetyllegionaminic acid synthase